MEGVYRAVRRAVIYCVDRSDDIRADFYREPTLAEAGHVASQVDGPVSVDDLMILEFKDPATTDYRHVYAKDPHFLNRLGVVTEDLVAEEDLDYIGVVSDAGWERLLDLEPNYLRQGLSKPSRARAEVESMAARYGEQYGWG